MDIPSTSLTDRPFKTCGEAIEAGLKTLTKLAEITARTNDNREAGGQEMIELMWNAPELSTQLVELQKFLDGIFVAAASISLARSVGATLEELQARR